MLFVDSSAGGIVLSSGLLILCLLSKFIN